MLNNIFEKNKEVFLSEYRIDDHICLDDLLDDELERFSWKCVMDDFGVDN